MKTARTYIRVPSVSLQAGVVRERIKTMRDVTPGKMEAQLAAWGASLDELLAKTGEAATGAKSDLRKKADDMRATCQSARTKLDEFGSAGGAKWDVFKAGIDSAWSELETTFKRIATPTSSEPTTTDTPQPSPAVPTRRKVRP